LGRSRICGAPLRAFALGGDGGVLDALALRRVRDTAARMMSGGILGLLERAAQLLRKARAVAFDLGQRRAAPVLGVGDHCLDALDLLELVAHESRKRNFRAFRSAQGADWMYCVMNCSAPSFRGREHSDRRYAPSEHRLRERSPE
jgi:hypothetical protein